MKNVKMILFLFLVQFFVVKAEWIFEVRGFPYSGSLVANRDIPKEELCPGDAAIVINHSFFSPDATEPSDIEETIVCRELRSLELEDNDTNFESLYRIHSYNIYNKSEKIEINVRNVNAVKFIINFNNNYSQIPLNPRYIDAVVSCLNYHEFICENGDDAQGIDFDNRSKCIKCNGTKGLRREDIYRAYDMICDLYDE